MGKKVEIGETETEETGTKETDKNMEATRLAKEPERKIYPKLCQLAHPAFNH